MELIENILIHGSLAGMLLILYILPIMRFVNPRVWAFSDYPKSITSSVAPQTRAERRHGTVIFIPFLILVIAFPLVSTMVFEMNSGGYQFSIGVNSLQISNGVKTFIGEMFS